MFPPKLGRDGRLKTERCERGHGFGAQALGAKIGPHGPAGGSNRLGHGGEEPVLVVLLNAGFGIHPELNASNLRALSQEDRESLGAIVEQVLIAESLNE